MRLSLVTFAVELYAAVDTSERVTLHQIHKPTGSRIRYQKVVPDLGPVPPETIVKGYEYAKDEYVLLDDEELENLRLESRHTIDLVQFVDLHEVDARYFEKPYYVVPQKGLGEEAFRVVRDALRASKRAALGQIVLSGRERIGAIRPCGKGLVLETLRYGEEVREVDSYFDPIAEGTSEPDQVELAEALIQKRSKPFDPEAFKDHYQAALRELVQAKMAGHKPEPVEETRGQVIDLTEALRRSLGQRGDARKSDERAAPSAAAAKPAQASNAKPAAASDGAEAPRKAGAATKKGRAKAPAAPTTKAPSRKAGRHDDAA